MKTSVERPSFSSKRLFLHIQPLNTFLIHVGQPTKAVVGSENVHIQHIHPLLDAMISVSPVSKFTPATQPVLALFGIPKALTSSDCYVDLQASE